jgi:alpha-L-fucosidase
MTDMLRKILLLAIALVAVHAGYAQTATPANDDVPLAPPEYRRPEGYDPAPFRYPYSLHDMQTQFSESLMRHAAQEYARMEATFATGKWQPTAASLDAHQPPEWFSDLKFGMFIDWGLWSVAGYATKMENDAMYPDWYEYRMVDDGRPYKDNHTSLIPYHHKNWGADFERGDLIPLFTATRYDAAALAGLAVDAGMRYIIPFAKHFSGWCLWPSTYTHMDAGDRLGRDFIAPLAAECRAKSLKFGFYYGTQEWEYPIIGDDGALLCRTWFRGNTTIGKYEPAELHSHNGSKGVSIPEWENIIPGKIPVRDFLRDYLIPQAMEFIDRYDPDILWYDGDWTDPVENLGTCEMAAYFYNQAEGRKDVAVNDRYGITNGRNTRKKRGDIFVSEYGYNANGQLSPRPWMTHPWEENRGISPSFGFNWQDTDGNVISSKKLIDMLVNIVSHGGNLLLLVNLDAQGAVPDVQRRRLHDAGAWLRVNGEGIYATRACTTPSEGAVRYTRSKDSTTVYAIALDWPGDRLALQGVTPAPGSEVHLLGYDHPLPWTHANGVTTVTLPAALLNAAARPCAYAWVFRFRIK